MNGWFLNNSDSVLEDIGSILLSIGPFITRLFDDLLKFLDLLAEGIASLTSILGVLPSPVVTLIISAFGITTTFVVIGRGGH